METVKAEVMVELASENYETAINQRDRIQRIKTILFDSSQKIILFNSFSNAY